MGWLKSLYCYLVFQERELILIHLDRKAFGNAITEHDKEMKAEGKGFIARTMSRFNFGRNYGQRYYTFSRADLLALDSRNFALDYDAIQKFTFRIAREHTSSDPEDPGGFSPGTIVIQTATDKMKFTHEATDSNHAIERMLTDLFGPRLKYRAS